MKSSNCMARSPRLLSYCLERTEVEVPSTTLPTRCYRVVWVGAGAPRCTCPGYAGHKHCKHGPLAATWLAGEEGCQQVLGLVDAQLEAMRDALPQGMEEVSPAWYLRRALGAVRDEIAARLAGFAGESPSEREEFSMEGGGAVAVAERVRPTAGPLQVSELRDGLFVEQKDAAGRVRCLAKLPRAALGEHESAVAEQVANARLFAAAPELFECLEAVGETFAVWAAENSLSSAERALWERVEATLERARGCALSEAG